MMFEDSFLEEAYEDRYTDPLSYEPNDDEPNDKDAYCDCNDSNRRCDDCIERNY